MDQGQPDAIHPLISKLNEALVLESKFQPHLQLPSVSQVCHCAEALFSPIPVECLIKYLSIHLYSHNNQRTAEFIFMKFHMVESYENVLSHFSFQSAGKF
jgi:hypothetical protein